MLLLLTELSKIQPVVEAVQVPIVKDWIVHVPPKLSVAVQVVPPTQVALSKVTVSLAPGTEAPVPPETEPHIEVSDGVMVQVVGQVRKRAAASAEPERVSARRRPRRKRFIICTRC